MRVVVDTSVLISALLWGGLPHRVLELAESGAITLCATENTLAELRGVLGRPKFQNRLLARGATLETAMQGILGLVELYPHIPLPGSVPDDPDDDIFVSCAVTADTPYLISGDRHLLELGQFENTRIASVRTFIDLEFPDLID
jgi:putative PIN family toxin of toxin-antitoxin system